MKATSFYIADVSGLCCDAENEAPCLDAQVLREHYHFAVSYQSRATMKTRLYAPGVIA